jgi:transcription elongation factor Elf1
VEIKGVCRPSEIEKEFLKKLQRDIKKCPFCSRKLGKIAIIKRKTKRFCRCKNCGEMIFDMQIYW